MINAIRWANSPALSAQLTPWHIPAGKRKARRTVCGILIREGTAIISDTVEAHLICKACRHAPTNYGKQTTIKKEITQEEIDRALEKFLDDGGIIERQPKTVAIKHGRRVGGDDGRIMGDPASYMFNF